MSYLSQWMRRWREAPVSAPAAIIPPKSLEARVYYAARDRGFIVPDEEGEYETFYVEGCNRDGTANANRRNAFDDIRLLLLMQQGRIVNDGCWEATTQPGEHFVKHRINPGGAANIIHGQQTSWRPGMHRGKYLALVQTGAVVGVTRDANEDFSREGDTQFVGGFGINQHHAYNAPRDNIGAHSAGCLVARMVDGHEEFMQKVMQDPRYLENKQEFIFSACVMPYAWIKER